MKENKYDDAAFFEQYSRMDRSVHGLQSAGEWSTLRRMLPDFKDKRVLDLGCGFGWHCMYAVQHGAQSVMGVDLSEKMIAGAKARNADPRITYVQAAIEDFDFGNTACEVVLSSLALHYLASFGDICRRIHDALTPGGEFVFSVEHPVFTAEGGQQWVCDTQGNPLHWPVDRYFSEGRRTAVFLGEKVTKYHRTLTTYLSELLRTGFEITAVAEPKPPAELLDTVEGMRDELRRPMMLLIAARKRF